MCFYLIHLISTAPNWGPEIIGICCDIFLALNLLYKAVQILRRK